VTVCEVLKNKGTVVGNDYCEREYNKCAKSTVNNDVYFQDADKVELRASTRIHPRTHEASAGNALIANGYLLNYKRTDVFGNMVRIVIIRDGSTSDEVEADIHETLETNMVPYTSAEEKEFASEIASWNKNHALHGRPCAMDDKDFSESKRGTNFGYARDYRFEIGGINLTVPDLLLLQAHYVWSFGWNGNVWWAFSPYCRRSKSSTGPIYCTTTEKSHMVLLNRDDDMQVRNKFRVSTVTCEGRTWNRDCIYNYCSWYHNGNIDEGRCGAPLACEQGETKELRYWPGSEKTTDKLNQVLNQREEYEADCWRTTNPGQPW